MRWREREREVAAPKCTRTQIPLSGRTAGQVSCLLGYVSISLHLHFGVSGCWPSLLRAREGEGEREQQPALNLRINAHNFISIQDRAASASATASSSRAFPAARQLLCRLSFWHMKRLPTWRVIIIFPSYACVCASVSVGS